MSAKAGIQQGLHNYGFESMQRRLGSIDWKKVFTAAKTGGDKNYFIEQNMEMTKEGVAYLKTLKV